MLQSEANKRGINRGVINERIKSAVDGLQSVKQSLGELDRSWFGPGSIAKMRTKLFSDEGVRIPSSIVSMPKGEWDMLFKVLWDAGSHFAHAKPTVLYLNYHPEGGGDRSPVN
jgi:hypothetical protein